MADGWASERHQQMKGTVHGSLVKSVYTATCVIADDDGYLLCNMPTDGRSGQMCGHSLWSSPPIKGSLKLMENYRTIRRFSYHITHHRQSIEK
ncbi:hypothetical protein DPMN_087547 [Dreissena polymorpha]|uniref:Uncharacterized protein n=1 Tax=Dreissena polymorpha TaxID=45954 RepID=A0A9D4KSK6_DREPO|nr:hypothetical protein DPMN_087547 [Dreissena polymorpha]